MTLNRVLLNFSGGKVHNCINHRIIKYPEWDGTHKDHWSSASGPAQDTCRTHTIFRATDFWCCFVQYSLLSAAWWSLDHQGTGLMSTSGYMAGPGFYRAHFKEKLAEKEWHFAHQDRGEFPGRHLKKISLAKWVDVSGSMTGSQVGFEVASAK